MSVGVDYYSPNAEFYNKPDDYYHLHLHQDVTGHLHIAVDSREDAEHKAGKDHAEPATQRTTSSAGSSPRVRMHTTLAPVANLLANNQMRCIDSAYTA